MSCPSRRVKRLSSRRAYSFSSLLRVGGNTVNAARRMALPHTFRNLLSSRSAMARGSFLLWPLQIYEAVLDAVPLVLFFKYFFGEFGFVRGEKRIGFTFRINESQVELVYSSEGLFVDLRSPAAMDFHIVQCLGFFYPLLQRMRNNNIVITTYEVVMTGNDYVRSLRQRLALGIAED